MPDSACTTFSQAIPTGTVQYIRRVLFGNIGSFPSVGGFSFAFCLPLTPRNMVSAGVRLVTPGRWQSYVSPRPSPQTEPNTLVKHFDWRIIPRHKPIHRPAKASGQWRDTTEVKGRQFLFELRCCRCRARSIRGSGTSQRRATSAYRALEIQGLTNARGTAAT